jgi:hypothetical protein
MTTRTNITFDMGLPVTPLTENVELFTELLRIYSALRNVAITLDSYTGAAVPDSTLWDSVGSSGILVANHTRLFYPAMENISYGQTVSIVNDSGTAKVRLAKDGNYPCRGFCADPAGVTTGNYTYISFSGVLPEFAPSTLTPGALYYQSATAGAIGAIGSAPAWKQVVGFALSDTQLFLIPQLTH